MTQERKSVDEMLDWLGLDTDAKAIEDREALNTDEEYCKLYDDAEWYGQKYYDEHYNWQSAWRWILFNWDKSRLSDKSHFATLLRYAKETHHFAMKAKAGFMKARQAFADFVAAENEAWIAEAV